ncbi:MAG: type IV secretion system protein [Gammaproteobacteria bacterium]|nr:MAG: type IV secretion system protein [Gammaproteobacteria bacterium]
MITQILEKVDTLTQQFVFNGYQQLANTYAPAIYGMVTLFIIIYGYAVIQGYVTLSLAETSKRVLTAGFILMLALDWATFSKYVYDLFTITPDEISSVLMKSTPNSNFSDANGVDAALQQTWTDGMNIAIALWQRGGMSNLLPLICSVAIYFLVIALVGIALIALIAAKFGLAIFLVLAPITIPMMFFKPTREIIFDGWLKCSVTCALVPIFITSTLALCLTVLSDFVVEIKQAISTDTLTIEPAGEYALFTFVSVGLVIIAADMARSMAGGFTTGMSPYVARAAGGVAKRVAAKTGSLAAAGAKSAWGKLTSSLSSSSTSTPSNPSHI